MDLARLAAECNLTAIKIFTRTRRRFALEGVRLTRLRDRSGVPSRPAERSVRSLSCHRECLKDVVSLIAEP
jgi:hypothetical protein